MNFFPPHSFFAIGDIRY